MPLPHAARAADSLGHAPPSPPPDLYAGPLNRCVVFRRNRIENNGHIAVLGSTSDAIVEHCAVRDSDRGIEVGRATEHVLLRRNTLSRVARPLFGDGLEHARVVP